MLAAAAVNSPSSLTLQACICGVEQNTGFATLLQTGIQEVSASWNTPSILGQYLLCFVHELLATFWKQSPLDWRSTCISDYTRVSRCSAGGQILNSHSVAAACEFSGSTRRAPCPPRERIPCDWLWYGLLLPGLRAKRRSVCCCAMVNVLNRIISDCRFRPRPCLSERKRRERTGLREDMLRIESRMASRCRPQRKRTRMS